jgi:hypothetical protein
MTPQEDQKQLQQQEQQRQNQFRNDGKGKKDPAEEHKPSSIEDDVDPDDAFDEEETEKGIRRQT